MARKANIAKEEIIEACWQLIEHNTFPNIPRLSQHFLQLDGRACSNTTLLNAINEWEERYREHQESELSDLNESLAPSFKRFERDVVNAMSVLLDEKVNAHENALALRQSALEGRSDSLHEQYIACQEDLEKLSVNNEQLARENEQLTQRNEQLQERYDHAMARTRVLTSELEQGQRQLREATSQLNQAQVDLAKQDTQIAMLTETLDQARAEIDQLKHHQQAEHDQMLSQALADLQEITKSLAHKKADA